MSKQSDIALLSMVLVLLSASIGILHGRKKMVDPSIIADDAARIMLTQQDALDYLQPHLIAGNIDSAAATLHQFVDPLFFSVVEAILDDSSSVLSNPQKIELLAGVLEYDQLQKQYHKVMPLLVDRFKDQPVFVYFIKNYFRMIPHLISWMKNSPQMADVLDNWIAQSFKVLVEQDDPETLARLHALVQMHPSQDLINTLLVKVAKEGKSPLFLDLLVDQLGGQLSYSPDRKKTLLMLAVEANNVPLVKALLAKGASHSKVLDSATGSARQIAFERGLHSIEALL